MALPRNLVCSAVCSVFLLSTAIATPISIEVEDNTSPAALGRGTFRISQVENPAYSAFGPLAYAKAFQKYSSAVPEELVSAMPMLASAAATNDTVVAIPLQYDSEYLCPVQIGTPPQTLNLDFDTGSADLWVFSTETAINQTQGQTPYQPGNSSTAMLLTGAAWKIGYVDGSSASGNVYLDTVSIGPVTVDQQAIESASSVSPSFTRNSARSGLLGLAFDSLNAVTPKQVTFFSNAATALALPLFTANLQKGAVGNYNFGFIDNSEHTGSITYVPITTARGYWEFNSTGYAIGNRTFVNLTIDAVADTGTTLLLLPDVVVSAYWTAVAGAIKEMPNGGYVFPCNATLPDFIFGIGKYRGRVPGRYLNFAPVNDTMCYGGLQSSSRIGFAIFGDILLKSQFVVFDAGKSRLGWAPKPLTR